MKKGLFITLEGADGSGKTTQLKKIAEYFDEHNINYLITRDPGGTDLGLKLRDILLNYEGDVSDNCELLLYLADRAQHIDTKIFPAIERGVVVVCDRHIDSTVAYQGYGRGLDIEKINLLNNIVTHSRKPDLTLLFDVDTDTASKRVGENKDRLESLSKEFHKKVRMGYLELAKAEPERFRVLDANRSIDEVFEQVKDVLDLLVLG